MKIKTRFILAGFALMAANLGAPQAAEIDEDLKARRGTIRCGGSNFLRQNGTEQHATFWNLRNFNHSIPITVERMTFYDANGMVLFDTNTSGFPVFGNGVLGPGDQMLQPNQTAELNSFDVLPFLPPNQRPIQLEITWSAPQRALVLDGVLVRVARERDPVTGVQGEERSRHLRDCRTISVNR